MRAPFNQASNFGCARPFQSVRQKFYHLNTSTESSPPSHMAWGLLFLPAPTADPTSSLSPRPKEPTHPSSPVGRGCLGVRPLASVWTFGDHPGRHTEVRIMHNFTSVPESSWLWRKLHRKIQLFQRKGGGMWYWPACWVAYKRKSGRAQSSVCSQ